MKVVDANVLLYAVDELAQQHEAAKRWIEESISQGTRILFPWIVLVGFVRLSTGRSFMANPITAEQAISLVEDWLSPQGSTVPLLDAKHLQRWQALIESTGTGGNIVNDAHLAAIALQYNATVVSFDHDFKEFPGVRWETPA